MKCPKCNAELTEDTKFCSFCGEKIEQSTNKPEENSGNLGEKSKKDVKPDVLKNTSSKSTKTGTSMADKIKEKCSQQWSKLSPFGKIVTVAIIVFTLLCFIAFIAGKPLAGMIAVVQIALVVVAILLKKQIIKAPKTWIYIMSIALAVVLLVPYFSLFSAKKIDAEKYVWSDIVLNEIIPKPKSNLGNIYANTESSLSMEICKTSASQYDAYVQDCISKGFTLDTEQTDGSFDAFDGNGYKLSLYFLESTEEMNITVDAPTEYSSLVWPSEGLSQMIPKPTSETGEVINDDEKSFLVIVANTTIEDYKLYVQNCVDGGFSVDANDTDKHYGAKNTEGYRLTTDYQGNNTIKIVVEEPEYAVDIKVECVENLLFSKYDVDVTIDGIEQGTITHGATETYSLSLTKGTYTAEFVSDEDDSLTGEITFEVTKDEAINLKISCSSSGIDVKNLSAEQQTEEGSSEAVESTENTETTQLTVTKSSSDFEGMDYTEAEKLFREMGFTSFKYEVVDTDDQTKTDETICYTEIKGWVFGTSDFSNGDTFASDSTVVFYYYECEEIEPSLTVDNCPELAAMLSNKAEIDDSYSAFVTKYAGRTIEFDGRIDYCTKHENYNTRFDYLVSAGNYDADHQIGPTFKFEDVNYSDLHTDLDTVSVGLNVHIVAEVVSYNSNSGLFFLDPVSVTSR